MIIKNIRWGKKQVFRVYQNDQVIWEYDNKMPIGDGTVESVTFTNVMLQAAKLYEVHIEATGQSVTEVRYSPLPPMPLTVQYVSQHNKDADLATPWAKRLYAELISQHIMEADLAKPWAKRLFSLNITDSYSDAEMRTPWAQRLYAAHTSSAPHDAPLRLPWANRLYAGVISRYTREAEIAMPLAERMGVAFISQYARDAVITPLPPEPLMVGFISEYTKGAILSEPSAKGVAADFTSRHTQEAELGNPNTERLAVNFSTKSILNAGVQQVGATRLPGEIMSVTDGNVSLGCLMYAGFRFAQNIASGTATSLWLKETISHYKFFTMAQSFFSEAAANLDLKAPEILGEHLGFLSSCSRGDLEAKDLINLGKYMEVVETISSSIATLKQIAAMQSQEPLFSIHAGDLEARRIVNMGAYSELLKTCHSGMVNAIASLPMLWGGELLFSEHSGTADILPPTYAAGTDKVYSSHGGEVITPEANGASSTDMAQSGSVAAVDTVTMAYMKSHSQSQNHVNAALDFIWWHPIFEDGVLYIRSSYEHTQQGEVLLFDTVETEWADPVLVDGVLTISQSRMPIGGEILEVN